MRPFHALKENFAIFENRAKKAVLQFLYCSDEALSCCSRGIAQLGERLHGMQEVIGSIPFTSTKVFDG